MNSYIINMLTHHYIDCIHWYLMNIVNILMESLNNTQLNIINIKCCYINNNKEQDWHNHCMKFHLNKTYYYKIHNCWDLSINIHHILVVYIGDIYYQLCRDKIQLCIGYRKMESYNKYILIKWINIICMYCQYGDNNQLDIVNIGC